MAVVVFLLIAGLLVAMALASVLMAHAGNRSALWSAGAGAVVAPLVLVAAGGIAVLMTRAEQPFPRAGGSAREPDARQVRVLVLNFDPKVPEAGGRRLHEAFGWHAPRELADAYAADVERASRGFVRFTIVEWRDVDAFPRKVDGFVYTTAAYLGHHRTGGWHQPDGADYRRLIADHEVAPLVDSGRLDEVWLFGGPYFGYSEAAMAGPGAFDVNGAVFGDVDAARPFVLMGFNYERGVAEMLENLCHRVEATMSRVYGGWEAGRLDHAWARFAANEAQSGGAAVGSCHWPPNAEREYDFDNPRPVLSTARTWLTYPVTADARAPVNRETWGGPDYARGYFRWWLRHLPRAEGTDADGREHNWWKYVFDPHAYDADGRRAR